MLYRKEVAEELYKIYPVSIPSYFHALIFISYLAVHYFRISFLMP